ncbi:MAG: response regulator transcription factor [Clostridiales bacterium]|nr:response regulator transcription factor [Clostridiales bacterium]
MKILVCEDEKDLNAVIVQKLKEENYSVDYCYDGEDGLYYLENAEYDLALIDVMMPKLDGFELVRRYRMNGGSTPILMLTARDSIDDKVQGLDIGANDYLTKPFSFDELTARIRALTRKSTNNYSNIYTVADLSVDTLTKKVTRSGKEIRLSVKEYALLEYLIKNQGRVLSREQIENNIYNFDYDGTTNVIDVYIRFLRKKIDDGFDKKLIKTVRGYGYTIREEE